MKPTLNLRKASRRTVVVTSAFLVVGLFTLSASAQFITSGFGTTQLQGLNPVINESNPVLGGSGGSNPLGSSLGGGSGTQAGSGGVLQSVLGPLQGQIGGYLEQINGIKDQVLGGLNGGIAGQLDGLLKDAIGSLGLPDLGKLREQISKAVGKGEASEPNGTNKALNPSVINSGAELRALKPAVEAGFSKEAQDRSVQGLQTIAQKVSGMSGTQQASKTAAQGSATASQESQKMAQQATQQGKTAQGRVSTQDAIKDLNMTAALQSTQLSQVSTQLAGHADQLGTLTDQTAASVELQGISATYLNRLESGQAITNASLLRVNDQLQGADQARLIESSALQERLNKVNNNGFRLMR